MTRRAPRAAAGQRADHARYLAGRLDKRQLLRRAWGLARDGARRFGGTVRAYLAEALRQSWAEVKARIATARAMAEDRAARGWSPRDPAAIEERFALTVWACSPCARPRPPAPPPEPRERAGRGGVGPRPARPRAGRETAHACPALA